jgi:hypothetical protein
MIYTILFLLQKPPSYDQFNDPSYCVFYWIQKNTSLRTPKGRADFLDHCWTQHNSDPSLLNLFMSEIYIYRSPKRAAKTRPEATHRSNGTIAEIREWIRKKNT